MDKNLKISDRKKEKVLSKFLALINKGCSIQYCENKFKKYKNILDEYVPVINRIKKLKNDNLSEGFLKNILNKIYEDESKEDIDTSYNKTFYNNYANKKHLILKPVIIFLIVFVFLTFSFIGIAYASQNSIPGGILYPVKRSVENIKLIVYPESKKNMLYFQFLNNRLHEANSLYDSVTVKKIETEKILNEVDENFEQLKKNNYFGDKSEEELNDLINDVKNKYEDKYNEEINIENGKKENNSEKTGDSAKNNSGIEDKGGKQESKTGENFDNNKKVDTTTSEKQNE